MSCNWLQLGRVEFRYNWIKAIALLLCDSLGAALLWAPFPFLVHFFDSCKMTAALSDVISLWHIPPQQTKKMHYSTCIACDKLKLTYWVNKLLWKSIAIKGNTSLMKLTDRMYWQVLNFLFLPNCSPWLSWLSVVHYPNIKKADLVWVLLGDFNYWKCKTGFYFLKNFSSLVFIPLNSYHFELWLVVT